MFSVPWFEEGDRPDKRQGRRTETEGTRNWEEEGGERDFCGTYFFYVLLSAAMVVVRTTP